MAYYEFFNLPPAQNWKEAAREPTARENRGEAQSEWAETGDKGSVRISFNLLSMTNDLGWIQTGPQYATVSIGRSVLMPHQATSSASPNIVVGDLLLYRIALLSLDPAWSADMGDATNWPGVYLEFDHQTSVRLRVTLKRLVISDWQLEAITDDHGSLAGVRETLTFRAWVIKLENSSGNPLEIALGDSAVPREGAA